MVRERRVWWAVVAVLAMLATWLGVLDVVLVLSLCRVEVGTAVTVMRALVRVAQVLVTHAGPGAWTLLLLPALMGALLQARLGARQLTVSVPSV
jgi:hypothetical protein